MLSRSGRDVSLRRRRGWGTCLRWLGCLAAGIAFQSTSGGCEETLSSIASTLGQDIVNGIGTGVSNLSQAFTLNLFI